MLKPLLFILVIVTLIALALNFNLFSDPVTVLVPSENSIEKTAIKPHKEKTILIESTPKYTFTESNLTKELQELLNMAQKLFRKNKDDEAILIYEKIIAKSKNSNDITILKLFAEACFNKANTHYAYPSYDVESAIETYELLVNNFKDRYNKELLIAYMQGKIQLSKLNSKDELLIAYDELIEKFTNDKEKRFKKEIEEMLFAKSFALMGVNDEEAIEALDRIIAQYEDKSNLPDTVKYSILNNIELSIITGNDSEKYVDLANEYMGNLPDTKPLLDMLDIMKNAQDLEQGEALEEWNEEHKKYLFPEWDFSELRRWANNMETPESQKRISHYLDTFEKKKYPKSYQTVPSPSPTNIQSTYPDPYPLSENEEITYEEVPAYEPNPYLNDIIGTEPETTYPNPYSDYEPSPQTDGVSHTYDSSY